MSDKPSWGGFFPSNIERWIIKECIESGDPVNFFRCLYDVVEEIDTQLFVVRKESQRIDYFQQRAQELGLFDE